MSDNSPSFTIHVVGGQTIYRWNTSFGSNLLQYLCFGFGFASGIVVVGSIVLAAVLPVSVVTAQSFGSGMFLSFMVLGIFLTLLGLYDDGSEFPILDVS